RGRWRPDPLAETPDGPSAGSAAAGGLLDGLARENTFERQGVYTYQATGKPVVAPARCTCRAGQDLGGVVYSPPGPGRDPDGRHHPGRQAHRTLRNQPSPGARRRAPPAEAAGWIQVAGLRP